VPVLSHGAGYVLKRDRSGRLIDSIHQAARGESAWTAEERKQLTGGLDGDFDVHLSPREGEVLKQISHGLTNKEIALMFDISYETVKEHVR
jgi:DNA-binding NarL/FixJ family response regulator